MHPSKRTLPRALAMAAATTASLLSAPSHCSAFSPPRTNIVGRSASSSSASVTSWGTVLDAPSLSSSALFMARGYGDGSGKTLKDKLNNPGGDEEYHPRDAARTTPQLMHALWDMIAYASKNMQRGDSSTVIFPEMESKLSDPAFLGRLLAHLDACKDVCDSFGANTVLIPHASADDARNVAGFTVKSYRNPNSAGTFAGEASEMKFAPDPFWDNDEEWDFGGVEVEDDSEFKGLPEIVDEIPDDDEVVVGATKRWVDRMMADLALCPFTANADKSGIPAGPVRYAVDRVTAMEDAYAAYWGEVCRVEGSDESDLSTTLQIMPGYCATSVELFEQWADTLTGTLEALQIEDLLQLIFFHPQWTFRDGGERSGTGLAANYARRSPWPMVNILRTNQVRTAQKGIPTGLVYQQNEKTLGRIGVRNLESMLRARDWTPVEGMRVDRKDMEALRVAQDLQVEGVVRDEDTAFAFDSTPAANKVDRKQIDGGNMVNVIREALEIRLGKKEGIVGGELNGAQTSAAMMATDFLLEELQRIEEETPGSARAPEVASGRPGSAMAKGGYGAAYGFSADEYDEEEGEDAEMSVLFGGGGIPMTNDEDNPSGMDLWKDF